MRGAATSRAPNPFPGSPTATAVVHHDDMVDDVIAEPRSRSRGTSDGDLPQRPRLESDSDPQRASQGSGTELRGRLGRWWVLSAALASGLVLLLAFPPLDLWWLAPVAIALLAVATHRRGFWAGAGLGLVAGLALFIPLLSWAGGYVGWVWLFLPAGEAAYVALLGGVSALSSPVVDRWRWTWPWVTGLMWVLQEALRDRTPFGGFPWGRVAFSQGDSPMLRLASVGGAPLVTFGVAVVGGLLALAAVTAAQVRARGVPARAFQVRPRGVRAAALALGAAVLVTASPLVVPSTAGGDGPTAHVAVVQGNVPRLGLDFNAQRRAVLDNHVNATLALAAEASAGRTPRPDFVVWPENASDIDPIRNADARTRIDEAAHAIGAPILVGGLLVGAGNRIKNVGLVWEPGRGPTQTYLKRHPVPFAEYIPMRPLVRLVTDKADLVRSDFVAGPTPGVLTLGTTTVGDVICFEVAYDEIVRDTVTGGAELLVVQTNNATFTRAEALQQLAMVRLRAVEHGRPALMASTVGVSAFVDETGNVYEPTQFNTKAVITRDLALRSGRTMATYLGAGPELALCVVAVGVVMAGAALRRTRRRVAH
jgi:apolipoprotein N-acyltransferase